MFLKHSLLAKERREMDGKKELQNKNKEEK
jgi:hypothetical protein